MKTRKPKIKFTVQLHEEISGRWSVSIVREEAGFCRSTVLATELFKDSASYRAIELVYVVGPHSALEEKTFEEQLPSKIERMEKLIAGWEAELPVADRSRATTCESLIKHYRKELVAHLAWTRQPLAKAA